MKILFDECVPHRPAEWFSGLEITTAGELGWSSVKDHQLLSLAANDFDLLITVDKRMPEQQNEAKLRIPVAVLIARSIQLKHLSPVVASLLPIIDQLKEPKFYTFYS